MEFIGPISCDTMERKEEMDGLMMEKVRKELHGKDYNDELI